MKARILKNLVGPQVRRFRCLRNWSQEELAERLQDMGWNVCRGRIAKIEAGEVWVCDIEQIILAKVFRVELDDLIPPISDKPSIYIVLSHLLGGQLKMLMPPDDIIADRSEKLLNGKGHATLSPIQDNISPVNEHIGE